MKDLKQKLCRIFLVTICLHLVNSHGAHHHKPSSSLADYFLLRESILAKEYQFSVAGSTELEGLEVQANEVLMKYATVEDNSGIQHPGYFSPFRDVPHYLEEIKESPVFKIIQAMPKGALLHTHVIGMGSAEYIYSLTYRKNLYVCTDPIDHTLKFRFLKHPEDDDTCNVGWKLLADERKNPFYNVYLREKLSMLKKVCFRDTKQIVETSKELNDILTGLLAYKPVFEDYVYQTMLELYEDGIRYFEIRCTIPELYDFDGNTYGPEDILLTFQDVLADFQYDYPDFYGIKLMCTFSRDLPEDEIIEHLHLYEYLRHKYGNFVAGIDIIGNEDRGKPLKDLVHLLLPLKEAGKAEFFLHAGVTNWLGIDADEDILDALLLGTRRIGHGNALPKHPKFMQMAKERGVAVEMAPISDRISGFYHNIGNHQGAVLGALGIDLVITNGNPGLQGAKGVSYDWYLAFIGYSSVKDDLRYLKKMALNSIEYSALCHQGKEDLYEIWKEEWDIFVEKLANGLIP